MGLDASRYPTTMAGGTFERSCTASGTPVDDPGHSASDVIQAFLDTTASLGKINRAPARACEPPAHSAQSKPGRYSGQCNEIFAFSVPQGCGSMSSSYARYFSAAPLPGGGRIRGVG